MHPGRWRTLLYRASNLTSPAYGKALREARFAAGAAAGDVRRHIDRKLHAYLRYCREYSPYWRERWPRGAEGFPVEEARDVLATLPSLRKEDLREHAEVLRVRPEARRSGDGFPPIVHQAPNWSGGSTGMPTQLWQDGLWGAANRAAVDFAYRSVGLEPGLPTFFLWGSENELADIRKSARKRASTWLRGLVAMPAFALDAAKMDEYARIIDQRTDVENALCFVSAVDTFTGHLEREGRRPRRLARVLTGGGTLTPDVRERIREFLADDVYDMYGSRDVGMMAMETADHVGLAVCSWHNYLEVLDERARPVAPGGSGRIHVTAINNYSTALIRFDMGDIATLGAEGEAAWNAPVLRQLSGRTAEHLIASDGTRIEPSAVIHLVGVVLRPPWLRKFQMVQEGPADFRLRVEPWSRVEPAALERLRGDVETSLSRLCKSPVSLAVEGVEVLEASPSGKHMYCVLAWDPARPEARA